MSTLFSVVTTTEPGSVNGVVGSGSDVNRFPMAAVAEEEEEAENGTMTLSSPNSTMSSFQMDFCIKKGRKKRDLEVEICHHERASDDDDEENGSTRKKLRLSKEQSAFLEESFKEHNTLNPVS